MNGVFSYFTTSTNKQPQQQQNTNKNICQQSQITYEEIDAIDDVSESLSSQKQNNLQHSPKANDEKSASSGGFQEIKQNDDSPLKIHKKPSQQQQPQQDLVQISVEDSFSYDDITQSISESHQVKNKQKSRLKTNTKSFFDIEEESPNCENLMDSAKIAVQYPCMSDSFNVNDYQNNNFMEESSLRHQPSKVKNNEIESEHVNKYLRLLTIQNNDNEQENDKLLTKTEEKTQNPLQTKINIPNFQKPETQCSFNAISHQNQEQDDLIDVSKSTFTEKLPTFTFKNNKNKNSSKKQKNTEQDSDQLQKQVQQSCYMKNISQKPQKEEFIKNQDKKQPKTQKQAPYIVYEKDSLFFIKYGYTPDRRLNDKIFQSLSQTFLMNNVMLPFFSLKLLEDHEGQIQMGVKKQKQKLFSSYTNIYFEFLHQRYQKITKQFFEKQSEKSQYKSKVFDSQIGLKKDDSGPIFGIFYKKVIDYFKITNYSKAKLLKQSLQSQLAFISQYKEKWIDSSTQNVVDKKQNEQKSQKLSQKILDQKTFYLLKQISGLELLISFEKSQMYCEDKLKEKLEEKIWKERKRKLIQDRNWFISHLFPSCEV